MKKNKHTYVVSMPLSVRSSFRKHTSKIYEKQKKIHLRGENAAEHEILFQNCIVQRFGIRGIYS